MIDRDNTDTDIALSKGYSQSSVNNPAIAYLLSLGSKKSRQTMGSFLNIVAKMIGFQSLRDCEWASMRRHHILAVMDMLSNAERAPTTINTYLSALKGVALEAWILKLIDTDSYQHIKQVKSVRGSRLSKGRALATEEVKKLFFVCDRDKSAIGVRDGAVLSVLIGCGLRRAEAVSLDHSNYDRRDRSLKVLGKGNKERVVFLPNGAYQRLEAWIEEVRGEVKGPLFTRIRRHDDTTNDRLSSQAVYHILDNRRVQAGLEKCAPHDLRRTFASSMLNNGEDLMTVKDAMGHASLTTTQKYDYRGNERLREASTRLDIG
nr:tyrosine-type recombinase/integrase [Marinomonas algarum]